MEKWLPLIALLVKVCGYMSGFSALEKFLSRREISLDLTVVLLSGLYWLFDKKNRESIGKIAKKRKNNKTPEKSHKKAKGSNVNTRKPRIMYLLGTLIYAIIFSIIFILGSYALPNFGTFLIIGNILGLCYCAFALNFRINFPEYEGEYKTKFIYGIHIVYVIQVAIGLIVVLVLEPSAASFMAESLILYYFLMFLIPHIVMRSNNRIHIQSSEKEKSNE